jgi:hypothetical protein
VELAVFDILGATAIHALVVKTASSVVQVSAAIEKDDSGGSSSASATVAKDAQTINPQQTVLTTDMARLERPSEIPMSSFQRRLWFIHNLVEDKSFLNISAFTSVLGKPDFHAFQLAIQEMVKRNDIPRTSFFEGDNAAEQSIVSTSAVSANVNFVDFREMLNLRSL